MYRFALFKTLFKMNMIQIQAMTDLVTEFQQNISVYTENVVRELSKKYNFDFEEAMMSLSEELKQTTHEKTPQPKNDEEQIFNRADEDVAKDCDVEEEDAAAVESAEESAEESESETVAANESNEGEGESESSSSNSDSDSDSSNQEDNVPQPYPKTAYPLPYTGVLYDSCHGIRLQHNMFVQCPAKSIKNASHNLCKTCFKQSQSNDHGKPNCGLIEDRMSVSFDAYKDPRGKRPKPFLQVLKQLKLEPSEVKAEFEEKGISVPSEFWEEQGKPTKKQQKKNKKKAEVVVSSSDEEMNDADHDTNNHDDNEDGDEIEEVDKDVDFVEYNNVKYYQSDDYILYDIETKTRIGYYCKKKNGVVFD